MVTSLVALGLRPAGAALTRARRLGGWGVRTAGDAATAVALGALDGLLASRFLDEALGRLLDSAAADRVLAGPELQRLVARLLESEQLWLLVDEIAQSPAVTRAITQQGAGFVDQVAGEVRERSDHADAWLERAARRVLRRRTQEGAPMGAPAAPEPPRPT